LARYVRATRKPRADWLTDDNPLTPDITVDDHEPVETGILWPDGEPVMRTPNPIGFGRDGDW
jgi:hypothetical protein